jgi:endonuclease/exonuclease/phosphatase family metal-dependent hydrolase
MTFNIRNSKDDRNTKNDWQNRKKKVLDIVKAYNPDIIGMQEVFYDQLDYLLENLPEYRSIGVGRDDGKLEGEFSPILYRSLDIVDSGTFWLSETPEICSNTWGGLNRICTWAIFAGDINFAVFNTHLEDTKQEIRKKSIQLLNNIINRLFPDKSVVILGDFNFSRSSQEYSMMKTLFKDAYMIEKLFSFHITYHGFKGIKRAIFSWRGGRVVDYIWLSGNIGVLKSDIIHDNPGNNKETYPSDHWPIIADLQFRIGNFD